LSEVIQREHIYQAEATALVGTLQRPFEHEIKPQAFTKLSERGGYEFNVTSDYRLEGAVSFQSGYTQVGGYDATLPCQGWVTLATASVEGLNILDVITADRVVAQVRTIHPLVGYVPSVTLLGTRFENLRISGHPVHLDLDLNLLGNKPANDAPYTKDPGFLARVASQYERLGKDQDLPAEIAARYNQLPLKSEDGESVECSLVNQAEASFAGTTTGHVIRIPHFGVVSLANLRVDQSDYQDGTGIPKKTTLRLTMIDLKLNCTGEGHIPVCEFITNGRGKP
jgi:hypothetical protein